MKEAVLVVLLMVIMCGSLYALLFVPDVPDGEDEYGAYEESQDGMYRIYRQFSGKALWQKFWARP